MKKPAHKLSRIAVQTSADPRWVKAIVTFKHVYNLQVGLPLLAKLINDRLVVQGYFARYTNPPFRLELQLYATATNEELFKAIMGYKYQNVRPKGVRFEDCEGSDAHAYAASIVMNLIAREKLTMAMLQDVTHWMYNMAGFSYVQEAAATAASAYFACRNIPGWSDSPIFAVKQVTKADERNRKAAHRTARRS